MARHFSMIRDFHAADFLTLGNAASGVLAIFLAFGYAARGGVGRIDGACALLVCALACDVLDGRVARHRRESSLMGRELDSLADVISFGVAPACLGFALGMRGAWALAPAFLVVCGVSRLARYNVTADAIAAEHGRVTYFEGAPITSSLLLVALLAALAHLGRTGPALPSLLVAIAYVALGSVMVSKTLHIPKP